jgi:NAD+ synthase (glutamine-hydrolysing)
VRRRAGENELPIAYLNMVGGQDDLIFDGGVLAASADGELVGPPPAWRDGLYALDYEPAARRYVPVDWQPGRESPVELIYDGLVRATRDYVDKNGFSGVLLGLSGGFDSALTLAIAVDALGAARVTAVMMPSEYTSTLSLDGAAAQARDLGVDYHVVPIAGPVAGFNAALAPLFAGRAPDITEENLQARARGMLLMALSNKFGRMVLTTGNKSEMAVGYATIYGDMCGGFAPLKDCYKTLVYALSRYRNTISAAIPEAVIERPPSAELRHDQKDQDSLPPYDLLDSVLERFIELDRSPEDIVAEGYDAATVHRVVALVLRNEYKRRQSAPGPRITHKAFGRDRRYPITSRWRMP